MTTKRCSRRCTGCSIRIAQWGWAWHGVRVAKSLIGRLEGGENRQARLAPGMRAMARVVESLGIEANHVVFGHLHHPGEWTTEGGTRLVNSGTWRGPQGVAACVMVKDGAPPELRHPLGG